MQETNRFALTCLLACLLAPVAGAQIYRVTDLGTLGGYYSAATGINALGDVVGYADTPDHSSVHAFLWTKATGMRDLNPPEIAQSLALAINDFGQVVGVAVTAGDHPTTHAFLWTRERGMQDLGSLGGASTAYGINDFGQVVGDSGTTGGGDDAFLWTKAGGMRDLGTLGGGASIALAINNFAQVVGGSFAEEGFHAFLWTKSGGMQDLGTLGGCEAEAAGINDISQVAGGSITTGCDPSSRHAFLWTKRAGMQDLGAPPGTSFGGPGTINILGMLVGAACPQPCLSQESVHAFIWTKGTGWLDLNELIAVDSGWVLENTQSINIWGQIAGQGFINGQYHAFRLTPNLRRRRAP